jgi:RNA polymerase sigma-70 factor (ECF subfamily)
VTGAGWFAARRPGGCVGAKLGARARPAGVADETAPDDLLLAAMATGDSDAALTFVRRFQRPVYGVAFAIIKDAGLAEDVAQQVFERAWRQADLYDPRRGSVRGWLVKIAHNLAVDAVRIRRPTPVAPTELTELINQSAADPGRVFGTSAAGDLAAAVGALPLEQARAIVLAAVHGFTAGEIAEIEDVPLGTAKSRIRMALAKLHSYRPGAHDDA